jgi:hypothetical protein
MNYKNVDFLPKFLSLLRSISVCKSITTSSNLTCLSSSFLISLHVLNMIIKVNIENKTMIRSQYQDVKEKKVIGMGDGRKLCKKQDFLNISVCILLLLRRFKQIMVAHFAFHNSFAGTKPYSRLSFIFLTCWID